MEVQREELCGRQCTLLIFKINLKDTRGCKKCFEVWKPDCFSLHVYSLVNSTHGTVSYTRENMPGVLSEELK